MACVLLAACGGTTNGTTGGGGTGGTTSTGGSTGGTGGGSTGGTGGTGGATGGTGGTSTGTGGTPMSLGNAGTVQNDCGPADGAAISLKAGASSTCNSGPNAAPQANFLAFPASVDKLAVGDQWESSNGSGSMGVQIQWLPAGDNGGSEGVKSGHLEVTSVSGGEIQFKYTFVTMGGVTYEGTVISPVCASSPMCG